jgi:hypothetical protein
MSIHETNSIDARGPICAVFNGCIDEAFDPVGHTDSVSTVPLRRASIEREREMKEAATLQIVRFILGYKETQNINDLRLAKNFLELMINIEVTRAQSV